MLMVVTETGKNHCKSYIYLIKSYLKLFYIDRAAAGRIGLANKLRDLGYHVFALDYRGYGDSTGSPTEMGVVNDLLLLNNFIKSYQPRAKIYLWVSIYTLNLFLIGFYRYDIFFRVTHWEQRKLLLVNHQNSKQFLLIFLLFKLILLALLLMQRKF